MKMLVTNNARKSNKGKRYLTRCEAMETLKHFRLC